MCDRRPYPHRSPTVHRYPCANPPHVGVREPSPRDPRRAWTRLGPRPRAFTNPTAVYLAAWADAFRYLETWEAWTAAHPEGGPL